jgi:F-type H+-transporting ATPase subunit epsilon
MLRLKVISPEKTVLETDCTYVTLPSSEGQITVYPHHAPIYTLVSNGEVIAHTADKGVISMAVGSGFANITQDSVTLLANFGILTDEIDEARANEAKARAESLIKEHKTNRDVILAEAELSRSLLELKLANKRKGG